MKTLTASKVAVLAACGSSTSVAATPFLSGSKNNKRLLAFQKEGSLKTTLVANLPRGGGGDDDANNKGTKDDSSENSKKPKQHPRQKKKKKRQRPKETSEQNSHKKQEEESSSSPNNKKSNDNKNTSHRHHAKKNTIVEEILTHEDFYVRLGVCQTATQTEITKAYRRRCVQTHPDKTGGDRRAFDKVAEAYDALSDENKRQLYDRFGTDGLSHNNGGGAGGMSSYQDVFRSMFQQQQQARRRRQNQTVRYQLQVTLEDLYNGMTQSVVVTPPNNNSHYQSRQNKSEKKVQVHVPAGSVSGQTIVLSGEMDFAENDIPGDLVFILTQMPHATFTRKGHDLAMELTISLKEAVCGLERSIRHLDGSDLWVRSALSADGETPLLVQTGDIQVLKGRGMPKKHHNSNGEQFGDLYIQYRVDMMPRTKNKKANHHPLSKEELQELAQLLGKLQGSSAASSSKKKPEKNDEVFSLQPASTNDFGRASGSIQQDEDEHNLHAHHDDDHGEEFHPFGSNFFQGSRSSGFYFGGNFGGHPFGGPGSYGNGDGSDGPGECHPM